MSNQECFSVYWLWGITHCRQFFEIKVLSLEIGFRSGGPGVFSIGDSITCACSSWWLFQSRWSESCSRGWRRQQGSFHQWESWKSRCRVVVALGKYYVRDLSHLFTSISVYIHFFSLSLSLWKCIWRFPKMRVPKIIPHWTILLLKPSVLGIPISRNPHIYVHVHVHGVYASITYRYIYTVSTLWPCGKP